MTTTGVYIFKFKYGKSARSAIRECRERNYAVAFVGDPRPVYYIGVNYNPADGVRTTDDISCERA